MQQEGFKLFDIIEEFFKETNLQWEHGNWLELLSRVERSGFIINPDELGLMLERERERRFR